MGFLDNLRKTNDETNAATTVKDPVCGMMINPADAAGTSQHAGKTIHFCSAGCKRKFDSDPAAYAAKL